MLKFQAEITGMLVFLTEITEVPAGCVHALTNSSCREPCNRRYRADSLVSPPPGFPRNSRMFVYGPSLEVITPSSTDLGERSDTLSSPRVSPLPWLGQNQHGGAVHGSVPELVITSPSGKSIIYITVYIFACTVQCRNCTYSSEIWQQRWTWAASRIFYIPLTYNEKSNWYD